MSEQCPHCDRSFDSPQGLGQHISAGHESDEPYKDEEKMRELYVGEGMSSKEIASKFECSSSTVIDWLGRLDIQTRKASHEKPPNFRTMSHGYEELRTQINGEYQAVLVHRLLAVAEYGYDAVVGKDVHHENGVPWDNRPENISPITRSEHIKTHHAGGHYDDHLDRLHQARDDSDGGTGDV